MTRDLALTRRSTLKLAGAGAIAAATTRIGILKSMAQDAAPAAGQQFAAMGLPELNITVTDTAFEGVDAQLSAGMYLVHMNSTGSSSGLLVFMQLPEGMTSADLMSMLGGEGGAASPVAGAEGQGDAPPDWFYTTYIAGGAGVAPGATAHFVINLQPGNYVVWGEDPGATQTPVDLTVTGDAASPTAIGNMPQAGVTITEVGTENGFAFELTGEFTTGTQALQVSNNSDQPHFVEIDTLPAGTTREEVEGLLQSFMTGTPTAGGLTEQDFQPAYFVGTQSANTTQWHEVSLPAGTYFIACWIPDGERGGIPHAMEGMYDIITISEGAMATPVS